MEAFVGEVQRIRTMSDIDGACSWCGSRITYLMGATVVHCPSCGRPYRPVGHPQDHLVPAAEGK